MTITARDLIPVIGYIRVSLAREEMISPEIQKAAITSWAARNGRRIVAWVPDLDKSGRNFKRRVMEAIEHVESGRAVEIAVYRYDRWGRNAVESLANVKRVEMVGGQVQSATEPFDVETAIGKYSRTNAFAIAEMQSDLIAENWRAAHAARVDRGLTSSGTPRFGYIRKGRIPDEVAEMPHRHRRDPNDPVERYEPDYAGGAADALVEMYDRYIAGSGYSVIASWANGQGYTTTRGRPWSAATVRRVLDSGFGAGLLRVHDPECPCRDPSRCNRKVFVRGAHEPVVDMDTWEQYLAARRDRTRMPPRSRDPRYPLTGLVVCGHCGKVMNAHTGNGIAGYRFICATYKTARLCRPISPLRSRLEDAVLDRLREFADEVERERDEAARGVVVRMRPPSTAQQRKRLEQALAEVDAALRRLAIQRATDEHMPIEIYEAARDELLDRRGQHERALAELGEPDDTLDPEQAAPIAHKLVADWEILPVARRREMLRTLVRHVVVYKPAGYGRPQVDVRLRWEECTCVRCSAT